LRRLDVGQHGRKLGRAGRRFCIGTNVNILRHRFEVVGS
jgi:hypothetical protein